jgi:hypothetical protein
VNQYVEMIIEHDEEYVIHLHHLELLDSKKSKIKKNNQNKKYLSINRKNLSIY